MARYQFFRVDPVDAVSDALKAHYDGDQRPATAEPREGLDAVVDLLADPARLPRQWQGREHGPAAAQAEIDRVQSIRRRGRKTTNVRVDMVLAGPPPYESPDAWSQAEILAWADDIRNWLAKGMPHVVVETFVLHQDERSPHLHGTIVPLDASGQYISWARVRPGLAGQAYDPQKHHVKLMKETLDYLYANISKKYGLKQDRGNDRVPRESAIDRNQGELLRAAEGGYSPEYLAGAREQVQWAAQAGPELRDRITAAEARTDNRFDFEVELLENYRLRFGGLDRAIRKRVEGTVPLAVHDLGLRIEALDDRKEELDQQTRAFRQELNQTEVWRQRSEAVFASRWQDLADREDEVQTQLAEVNTLLVDIKAERAELRERGTQMAELWRGFTHEAIKILPHEFIDRWLVPVHAALRELWSESRLAQLAERFEELRVPPPREPQARETHYREGRGGGFKHL